VRSRPGRRSRREHSKRQPAGSAADNQFPARSSQGCRSRLRAAPRPVVVEWARCCVSPRLSIPPVRSASRRGHAGRQARPNQWSCHREQTHGPVAAGARARTVIADLVSVLPGSRPVTSWPAASTLGCPRAHAAVWASQDNAEARRRQPHMGLPAFARDESCRGVSAESPHTLPRLDDVNGGQEKARGI
jgi:hypothetical protein